MPDKLNLFYDFICWIDSFCTWNALTVIIPNILLIIGWKITHNSNIKVQKQAELRNTCKELVLDIEKCQNMAIEYHTSSFRNCDLEHQIIVFLERLEMKTNILCKELKLTDDFYKVSEAITEHNFESSRFVTLNYQDDILQNIYAETNEQIKKFYLIKKG